MKRVAIAAPAIEEQNAILNVIATDNAPITTAITRYEREIALLREYRTRLTADVVTGKLDVRAAAQLPETKPAPAEVPVEPFEAESELEELEG